MRFYKRKESPYWNVCWKVGKKVYRVSTRQTDLDLAKLCAPTIVGHQAIQEKNALIAKQSENFLKKGEEPLRTTARYVKSILIEQRGHRCECCGIRNWFNGLPITLELHHIDENGGDIENNLQLLCPNCHSYTPNWRKRSKPDKDDERSYWGFSKHRLKQIHNPLKNNET